MNPMQVFQMLNQIKTNPMGILSQKFNIPEGVNLSDPNAIINHLLSSVGGKLSLATTIKYVDCCEDAWLLDSV